MPFFNETKEAYAQTFDAVVTVRVVDGETLIAVLMPSNDLVENGLMMVTAGDIESLHRDDYETSPVVVTVYTDNALFGNP